MPHIRFFRASLLSLSVAFLGGCGGREIVRGSDDPSIDAHAMSTGLDKEDVQRSLTTLLGKMRSAPVMDGWRARSERTTVAIAPIRNETSEHIEPVLQSLLGEVETWLVESQVVTVVSQERQSEMIRQVEGAQHPVFDPRHIPQYGRQLGVQYYVTGKVFAVDERNEDMRRVQYWLFLQVVEVETSAIRWQGKEEITKAVR
jgi:uncharacterized protein (TIGR02722 family)